MATAHDAATNASVDSTRRSSVSNNGDARVGRTRIVDPRARARNGSLAPGRARPTRLGGAAHVLLGERGRTSMVEIEDLTTGVTVARASEMLLNPEKRLLLVLGRSNLELAARIGTHLGCDIAARHAPGVRVATSHRRFDESVRGADVFIVQTGSHPVDRNLIELAVMVNAAKLASAKRIAAVVPLFFYARQDKKSRPREPITATVADLLKVAGVDRVLTMDLHAGQLQGFFDIPVDHMTALPMFAEYFRDLHPPGDLVGVSPDTGRTKLAGRFAEMLGAELVILNKTRPDDGDVSVTAVIGEVEGKVAVMIDDMIDTAGTIVTGAAALKAAAPPGCTPARRTACSTVRRSSGSRGARSTCWP